MDSIDEPFTPRPIVVLREASGVVAVLKPAGLPTQAPAGIDSMESRVREQLCGGSKTAYLGVPHRLDRPVSGVMLFALSPRAARQLSRQFERRQIRKRYRAILEPKAGAAAGPAWPDGWIEWRDRIAKIPDEAMARIVPAEEACDDAKDAVTRVRRCDTPAAATAGFEVEFEPVTGRMHQLRVQSGFRGVPVVGDMLYGAVRPFLPKSEGLAVPPIALHASSIEYLDPETGRPVAVEATPLWEED